METSFLALQTWIQTGIETVTSQNGNLIIYLEVRPCKPETSPELRQWPHKMETRLSGKSSPVNLNPVRSCDSDVTKWKLDYLEVQPCKPESSPELWEWRHKMETWLFTWKSSPPVSSWILLIRSATCPPEQRICHDDVMTAGALDISPILLFLKGQVRERERKWLNWETLGERKRKRKVHKEHAKVKKKRRIDRW